jgi:ATP/maltotriose-dependent transcriptional regulator MalT
MTRYTDVAIACDDHRAAAALYEWLVAYADQFPTDNVVPYAPVDHYLGQLATLLHHYEQAGDHFTRAADSAERAGATFFAAQTDLARGTMLLQRGDAGDTQRARAHLDSARSAAVTGGYTDIARRATEILERSS